MSGLEHARALLAKANEDFAALRGMSEPGAETFFTDAIFGLHAQQSAEKALKAWLSSLGERYERTHDLMALLERLEMLDADVGVFRELVDFNLYAVHYRYEILLADDDPIDRGAVVSKVRELISHVEAALAPDGDETE